MNKHNSVNLLALDTSSERCSVSLLVDSDANNIVSVSEHAPRSHAQRILALVRDALQQAHLGLADVDAIAFGRGPGSFTGLRIAAGFVQGLAFGQNLPVISVSNLEVLAARAFQSDGVQKCLALIDARMDEVYWAEFSRQENRSPLSISEERVDKPEFVSTAMQEKEGVTVIGSGLSYADRLGDIVNWPTISSEIEHPAAIIAQLALSHWINGNVVTAEQAAPVYIRDEVAWKKLPGRA